MTTTIQQMLDALEVISSHAYKESVLPILKDKKEIVVGWICSSKRNDEYNRGSLKTLDWMIGLETSLRHDIETEKNRRSSANKP